MKGTGDMDITLLEYGCTCSDIDDLNFCYEAVKEDFFEEIGGSSFNESGESGNKTAKIKSLIRDNKKKIAIIAGVAVALGTISVLLYRKGKNKEAAATKEASGKVKKLASLFSRKNKEIEKDASGSDPEKAVKKAGALNAKISAIAKKVTSIKDKLKAKVSKKSAKPVEEEPKFTENDKDFMDLIMNLNEIYKNTDEYLDQ